MSGGLSGGAQADEHPLTPSQQYLSYVKKLVYCIVYIIISSALIRFNKFLIKNHFPHSLMMSACQMFVCSFLCSVLYLVRPSMFPGMESSKGQRLSLLKWFVPIAVCFAIMLFGSNQAYLYCSVTFLQFMKEANAMIVFCFSCIVGLQSFTRLRCLVIVWVIVGAALTVSGEVHFAWAGFILQGVSQLAECARMVMGEIVLSGKKLDPLTYNLFLAPLCFIVLVIANAAHWSHHTWADFAVKWPLILGNSCLAFCLNVMVAVVIKECSAVGFVLTGLTKDIFIVLFSAIFFHETVTSKQAYAFIIMILGVFFWSYMKLYPSSMPVRAIERLLCVPQASDGEKAPLVPKDQPTTAEKKV
uniref:Sugar phosphate transporter domain-containing protein n=1 Tax=Alexandrium andersonii TaxID=327968 RepID=A0A7S2GN07_9DINO|mmetsp:Transcript_56754/g.127781  ORF Transcript_56754/g.127781 Transcript_56754/m.127781 type:complete len:358 (+) Transcript_56754:58-1131(+)